MRRQLTTIEVDQSIKIGDLSADTVLAYSNHIQFTVVVPAAVKQSMLALFRGRGKSTIRATVQVFAMALALLLRTAVSQASRIVIDTEYTGYERDIEGMLIYYLRKSGVEASNEVVTFRAVGKSSEAHRCAIDVHRRKRGPDQVLSIEDFNELM